MPQLRRRPGAAHLAHACLHARANRWRRPHLVLGGDDLMIPIECPCAESIAASQCALVRDVCSGSWSCNNAAVGSLTGLGCDAPPSPSVFEHIFPISSTGTSCGAPADDRRRFGGA